VTKAEARKRALEIRREVIRLRRELTEAGMHTEANMAGEACDGFDSLLRQTYEGEATVFACKR
jgi:hypothetical protein